MKILPLTREENRWDDLVAASEANEAIASVRGDTPAGSFLPPNAVPNDSNAIWDEFRKLRESLPKMGDSQAVRDIRELRES